MRQPSTYTRGFTLLEVMIASALGVVVLATGLVVGTQMQKRALFEEQTMMAQVTGRAVKELITADLARAGSGMGNTPISFGAADERSAITVWHKPDLKTGIGTTLAADPNFEPAPTTALASDALQLYWGETNGMVTLDTCVGGGSNLRADANNFCTVPEPSTAIVTPAGLTSAVLASGGTKIACPVSISGVSSNGPGSSGRLTIASPNLQSPKCQDGSALWTKGSGLPTDQENWMALRLSGAAYRVNWKNNIPTLEYQAPGQPGWSVVSRDVEQMIVREGVMDFGKPLNELEWYPGPNTYNPGMPHEALSTCTLAQYDSKACWLGSKQADGITDVTKPASDAELLQKMRQQVRQLEVTLVIRTRRINQDAVLTGVDEEGFVRDGYKRRRFTFTVEPRNFMSVGLIRQPAGATP